MTIAELIRELLLLDPSAPVYRDVQPWDDMVEATAAVVTTPSHRNSSGVQLKPGIIIR